MVAGEDGAEKIFNVVDAFDVPRFSYVAERKKYLPDSELGKPEPSLYAGNNEGSTRKKSILRAREKKPRKKKAHASKAKIERRNI